MADISDDETLLNGKDGSGSLHMSTSLLAGDCLGDYKIEKLIGAGAMGEVYLARQMRLNQQCAVKVLPEAFTKSADFEKRFESEGRSLARLDHPGIVRVLYAGEDSGRHFLSMEYVGGGNLDDYLAKTGALPAIEVRKILSEILAGLSYAHKREVIHRDLKPANILRSIDGHAKISDFGLALVAGEDYMRTVVDESVRQSRLVGIAGAPSPKNPSEKPRSNLDTAETILADESAGEHGSPDNDETLLESEVNGASKGKRSSGGDASALVGTIDYMSPEIRYGRGAADARSDIYAVGVIAYQMLTGRKPATGRAKDPSKIVKKLSPKWDEWVFKCMDEEPVDRFQSADEALAALPGSKNGSGWKISASIGMAAIIVGVAFGGWWMGSHSAKKSVEEGKPDVLTNAPVEIVETKPAKVEEKPVVTDMIRAQPSKAVESVAVVDKPVETKAEDSKPIVDEPAPRMPVAETCGALEIASDPPMVAWRLIKTPDGAQPSASEGTTPASLKNLPTGDYVVELSREGWPAELVAVRVEAGGTAAISHAFKGGSIYFSSNVSGVMWAIVSGPGNIAAQNLKNAAPYTLNDLPPGEYVVEFTRQYWPVIRKKVTVKAGETVTASVATEKKEPEKSAAKVEATSTNAAAGK
jgi:serine/threonine protein kinase